MVLFDVESDGVEDVVLEELFPSLVHSPVESVVLLDFVVEDADCGQSNAAVALGLELGIRLVCWRWSSSIERIWGLLCLWP